VARVENDVRSGKIKAGFVTTNLASLREHPVLEKNT
jgi:hypothetical protein